MLQKDVIAKFVKILKFCANLNLAHNYTISPLTEAIDKRVKPQLLNAI